MENGQKKLKELFDGRKIFRIPDYQRAYAWDESRQLPDFIEDIENQSLDRDYFLGTILFQESTEKSTPFDIIDVVDGQQRITTIIIFMRSLIDELSTRLSESEFLDSGLDLIGETYLSVRGRPKLQAITPDNDFFQSYILGNADGKDYIQTPSQRRLYKAKTYFKETLSSKSTEELLVLKSKIDERTKVLTYSVQDAAEATLIFETTNDRGKGLTNLEKIKSFLMYKTYLAAGDTLDTYLSSIQQRFTDVYRELELFEGFLPEDTALQYHCIAFERWSEKPDYQQPVDYIKKKLNPLISQGKNGQALEFIDKFTKELKESFITLRELNSCKIEAYRDLQSLDRMANFYPLLLKTYKLDQTTNKQKFETTCKLLEIYSFRLFSVQYHRSNTGQSTLHTAARDFSGKFSPLFEKIENLIKYHSPTKKFKEHLESAELFSSMASRDLSYLFWKYENNLRDTEQPICAPMSESEFRSTNNRTHLTVEHIASQNPKPSIIKDTSLLSGIDSTLLDENIHRLGNLTFDPASANSSKGNNEIEIKNSAYFQRAPYKTQNELQDFIIEGRWGVESINLREKKIINFCLKRWNPEYIVYPD